MEELALHRYNCDAELLLPRLVLDKGPALVDVRRVTERKL